MRQRYYKLTDQKMQTHNGFQWKLGEWQEAKGDVNQDLCSNAWLHCYDSPLLAVLHNPIHANIKNPRLFEVEIDGETKNDSGMKRGFRKMRLVKEIDAPKISDVQRIAYGILCAKKVYKAKNWNKWADNWLNNIDRSKKVAAAYVADAAYVAAYADAAYVAAYAAAAYVADTYVADAAYVAAYAAAYATIDLIELAEKAMTVIVFI